jgi:aspartate kinase
MKKTLVMKFGGASVASPESFDRVTEIILHQRQTYDHIVVVVSAMKGTTDDLIRLANQVHPHPPRREYDMLVTVGERISIALLAMALDKRQIKAKSFTGSQSGIITSSSHTDARIIDVRPERILRAMDNEGQIAIIAGFQGVSLEKEITTLGRGGSDTSAVALGVALQADKVVFYKDVLGIYSVDPKIKTDAVKYSQLSYQEALEVMQKGAKVLHARSIVLAQKNSVPLQVRSFFNLKDTGTWIENKNSKRPLHHSFEEDWDTSFAPNCRGEAHAIL